MANLIQAAREQVAQLTQSAYEKAAVEGLLPAGQDINGTVEVPKDSKNGDFASSFAMAGAKALHMAPGRLLRSFWIIWSWRAPYFSGRRLPVRDF